VKFKVQDPFTRHTDSIGGLLYRLVTFRDITRMVIGRVIQTDAAGRFMPHPVEVETEHYREQNYLAQRLLAGN